MALRPADQYSQDPAIKAQQIASDLVGKSGPASSPESDAAYVQTKGFLDPNSPTYMGPGYGQGVDPHTGQTIVVPLTDQASIDKQNLWKSQQAPADGSPAAPVNPNPDPMATVVDLTSRYKPAPAPLTPAQTLANTQAMRGTQTPARFDGSGFALPAYTSGTAKSLDVSIGTDAQKIFGGVGNPAPGTPGAPAPTVDTSKSDASIAGVNNTIASLLELARQSSGPSVAEAQLMKADQMQRINAQQDLQNSQAAALGAARSGNRRDQGQLERQAVGESAYLGQEAQRQDVTRQAELAGNLAITRATEADKETTRRAEILGKAADLGLNVAALQVDVGKADLNSASNALNQAFSSQNIDKQLSVDETRNALSYMQAMSAIQADYDKMSEQDKQHTQDLMMQQYGIDQGTATALAQIKANHKSTGEKVVDGLLGLAESAAPVIAVAAGGGKK